MRNRIILFLSCSALLHSYIFYCRSLLRKDVLCWLASVVSRDIWHNRIAHITAPLWSLIDNCRLQRRYLEGGHWMKMVVMFLFGWKVWDIIGWSDVTWSYRKYRSSAFPDDCFFCRDPFNSYAVTQFAEWRHSQAKITTLYHHHHHQNLLRRCSAGAQQRLAESYKNTCIK